VTSQPTSTPPGPTRPPLDETRGLYQLRYARDAGDVEACCRARYEVFNLELAEGLAESAAIGLDRDRYDEQCDHLMVIDTTTERVIGTYRMQTLETAEAAAGFYSAGEFDFGPAPRELMECSVELGRACVVREHREKAVLFLLWRGLMAYLLWNRKRFLFGCSSLTTQDPEEGLKAHDWLVREGHRHADFETPALPEYVCESAGHETFEGKYPIPRLFSTYLRHGAKITSPPALDRQFGTIDFLTLLDSEQFDRRLASIFALGLERR